MINYVGIHFYGIPRIAGSSFYDPFFMTLEANNTGIYIYISLKCSRVSPPLHRDFKGKGDCIRAFAYP